MPTFVKAQVVALRRALTKHGSFGLSVETMSKMLEIPKSQLTPPSTTLLRQLDHDLNKAHMFIDYLPYKNIYMFGEIPHKQKKRSRMGVGRFTYRVKKLGKTKIRVVVTALNNRASDLIDDALREYDINYTTGTLNEVLDAAGVEEYGEIIDVYTEGEDLIVELV